VTAGEHSDEYVIDDLSMPDDDLLDFGPEALEGRDELLDPSVLSHLDSSLIIEVTRS